MTQPNTVLILGARGRFGLAAARAFADAGWQVVAQMRPGAKVPSGAPTTHVRWLPLEVTDAQGLAAAAEGASVLVHALSPPAYTDAAWQTEAPAMLDAAMSVAQTLGATLMLPGNVYNFGATMPATLREDTTQLASTVKGRVRVAMEQRLQAAARDGALRSVVIRAGDFFGGGAGTWFDTVIVKDLPRGRVTWPDALEVPTAWAYLPDLARCFVQVAQQRHALPAFETLHFGGYSVTGQQWVHALSGIARERGWLAPGAQCKVRHLPWPLMRIFGLFSARFAALAPMRYLWQTPHQLTNARLLALIGQEPHTPLLDAARAALAELHVAGEKQARVAPLAATAKPAPRVG